MNEMVLDMKNVFFQGNPIPFWCGIVNEYNITTYYCTLGVPDIRYKINTITQLTC